MLLVHALGHGFALIQVSAVLGGLVGLLFLVQRMRGRAAPAGRTIQLTATHALHVVELEGRRFLIGTGPQAAPSVMDELDSIPGSAGEAKAERPRSDAWDGQAPPQVFALLLLALAPLGLAACTAFTKVSVVLAALRTGLGAEKLLPYGVVLALAVVVTAVLMGPTAIASWAALDAAGGPAALGAADFGTWLEVLAPLREFLLAHADPEELDFFAGLHGLPTEHPLVLVPAFLVTELGEALHIAVLILLPFILVDLLVAQVLSLLGLSEAPSAIVSLPAKVLLFLAVGGWQVVISGLAEGYL